MRRSTRKFMALASPPAVIMVGLALWRLCGSSAINDGNIARIQKGMTHAEVEAILDGPPRDESGGAVPLYGSWILLGDRMWRGRELAKWGGEEWVGDQKAVAVFFDEGRVSDKVAVDL